MSANRSQRSPIQRSPLSGRLQTVALERHRHKTLEMSIGVNGLGLTLLTTIVGAFVGAFASSRFGYQQRAFAEEDRRRRAVADITLPTLLELRRLLRSGDGSISSEEWSTVTQASYAALDDARYLLPPSLGHLKRISARRSERRSAASPLRTSSQECRTMNSSPTITNGSCLPTTI